MTGNQHTVRALNLDFNFSDEEDALLIHPRLSGICKTRLSNVIDKVLNKYDIKGNHININSITLDMTLVADNDFEYNFLLETEKKLDEMLSGIIAEGLHTSSRGISIEPQNINKVKLLQEFLVHGFISGRPINISWESLFIECLNSDPKSIIAFIIQNIKTHHFRIRLIRQFSNLLLFKLIRIAKPSDATFIIYYLERVMEMPLLNQDMAKNERREITFSITFLYLFADRGSRFNRKSFLIFNIEKLSAKYKISKIDLLNELLLSLNNNTNIILKTELINLIHEIRTEFNIADKNEYLHKDYLSKDPNIVLIRELLKANSKQQKTHLYQIISLLRKPDNRNLILKNLSNIEIYQLIILIAPNDAHFIISLFKNLNIYTKTDETANTNVRVANTKIWDVIFSLLTKKETTSINKIDFAKEAISKTSDITNITRGKQNNLLKKTIDYIDDALSTNKIFNDVKNILILFKSWLQEKQPETFGKDYLKHRIISLLLQPVSRRNFIAKLSEKEIYNLTELIEPEEAPFIINYAKSLDEEKQKGILEGKAGDEFRLLKWEFIFIALIEDRGSRFNRKSFIRSTLYMISSHYNIDPGSMFEYLYRGITNKNAVFSSEVSDIIKELYFEWKERRVIRNRKNNLDSTLQDYQSAQLLFKFISTGLLGDKHYSKRIYSIFTYLRTYRQDLLLNVLNELKSGFILDDEIKIESHLQLYRELIVFVISEFSLTLPGGREIKSLFQKISDKELENLSITTLKTILAACLNNDASLFEVVWNNLHKSSQHKKVLLPKILNYLSDEGLIEFLDYAGESESTYLVKKYQDEIFKRILKSPKLLLTLSVQFRVNSTLLQMLIDNMGLQSYLLFSKTFIMAGFGNIPSMLVKELVIQSKLHTVLDIHDIVRLLGNYMINLQLPTEKEASNSFVSSLLNLLTRSSKSKSFADKLKDKNSGYSSKLKSLIQLSVNSLKTSNSESTTKIIKEPKEEIVMKILGKRTTQFMASSITNIDRNKETEKRLYKVTDGYLFSILEKLINKNPQYCKKYLANSNSDIQKVTEWLKMSPESLKWQWLRIMSDTYVRNLIDVLIPLQSHLEDLFRENLLGKFQTKLLVDMLLDYVGGIYQNFNYQQFIKQYVNYILNNTHPNNQKIIMKSLMDYANNTNEMAKDQLIRTFTNIESSLYPKPEEEPEPLGKNFIPYEENEEEEIFESIFINNAGLVLLSPYFPRLFEMLELTDNRNFKNKQAQERAMFAIQYLINGKTNFPEHELVLNKIIIGYKTGTPVPTEILFSEKEKETMKSLLEAVITQWSGLGNTSIKALRESFLERAGKLEQREDSWLLVVENKGYDVLIDRLPWSYTPIMFHWMNKPIHVNWR
jgi:contractile injection system tape measure protein